MPALATKPATAASGNAAAHARIFDYLGIATYPDGDQSMAESCLARGLDPATVTAMLDAFDSVIDAAPAVSLELMTLTELCDHIEQTHHARLYDALSRLDMLIRAAAGSHLAKLHGAFQIFRDRISVHLRAEVGMLFPLIRRTEAGSQFFTESRWTLCAVMEEMEHDHNDVDETLSDLQALASAAGSPLYDAICSLENELQEQIYKENQLLFPKARALRSRIEL